MKFFPHMVHDDERGYITVRMNSSEQQELRKWMSTHPDQPCVSFPHGVRLERRSMGWYRLNPSNILRGAEKLNLAFRILAKFKYELRRKRDAEILQQRALQQKHIQAVAFVSDDSKVNGGTLHVRNNRTKQVTTVDQHVPATPNRLLELQQRFAR